jgi:peptidoglycan/LPS O-acetylase OafA/YrhL
MYFKSIQLLRAFAATMVVFFHALFFWNKKDDFLSHLFDNMYGSIDLFFVISGFVVFQSVVQSKQGVKQFFIFLQRRMIRIYPVYWLILLSFLAAGISRISWLVAVLQNILFTSLLSNSYSHYLDSALRNILLFFSRVLYP